MLTEIRSLLLKVIIGVINLVGFPIVSFIFVTLSLYRQIVKVLLFLRHGTKFHGLLSVYDSIHAIHNSQKNPVAFLAIIQDFRDHDFFEATKREIQQKVFTKKSSKALCCLQRALGYSYLIKNTVNSEEYIKKLEYIDGKEVTEIDVIKLIMKIKSPLPKNGSLWDVHVGIQPVKWLNRNGCYPILVRFNHVLSDGEHIVKSLISIFGDNFECNNNNQGTIKKFSFEDFLENAFKESMLFFMIPSIFLSQYFRVTTDSNTLQGLKLEEENILAAKVEQQPYYLKMIKDIKKTLHDCSFMDVILTALGASLHDHFAKTSLVPDYITLGIPESPNAVNLKKTTPASLSICHCQNHLSYTLLKLQIKGIESLKERLKITKELGSYYRNPLELQAGHWLQTLFGLLPLPLLDFLMSRSKVTMIVSNLPGPPSLTVFGNCKVIDFMPFGAHRNNTGVNMLIFSYEGRLQLTLNINKGLVSDETEVQQILDKTFINLRRLHKQTVFLST